MAGHVDQGDRYPGGGRMVKVGTEGSCACVSTHVSILLFGGNKAAQHANPPNLPDTGYARHLKFAHLGEPYRVWRSL